MSRYDDERLGEIMREGLHAHADRIDAATPVVGRPRRRPGAAVWIGAAAAAAVVAAGVPLAVGALSDPDGTQVADAPAVPDDWTFESYGGVQVRVPSGWAPGAGPMPDQFRDHDASGIWCADSYASIPYVGRPTYGSDVCMGFDPDQQEPPSADSVWFGAPVPDGTRPVGDYTQVTTTVEGVTVTATTLNPAVGRQILSTAEAIDTDAHGCQTHLDGPPSVQAPAVADTAAVTSLSVCLYDVAPDLETTLVWSDLVEVESAAYTQSMSDARGGDELAACKRAAEGEWVALGWNAVDSSDARWDVVDFACGKILSAEGDVHLTRESVEFWAGDATRAYIGGPGSGDWSGLFRGMLG